MLTTDTFDSKQMNRAALGEFVLAASWPPRWRSSAASSEPLSSPWRSSGGRSSRRSCSSLWELGKLIARRRHARGEPLTPPLFQRHIRRSARRHSSVSARWSAPQILSLLGTCGEVAAAAVWLSCAIVGGVAILQGYSYSKLGARYPTAGGLLEYVRTRRSETARPISCSSTPTAKRWSERFRVVAEHQAVVDERLLHRRHRRLPPLVARHDETDQPRRPVLRGDRRNRTAGGTSRRRSPTSR